MVALQRSGAVLRRVSAVFLTLVGSCSTPGIRAIEAEVAPRLAAHADAITLDPALFSRIDALFEQRHDLGLDPESLLLLERRHRDAVRAGARLGRADQERLRALNAELATLSTEFGARLLAAANDSAVLVEDPAQLDGLPAGAVSAAARAATARGHGGAHLLTLVLPTEQPVLASLRLRRENGDAFRRELLSRGGAVDPMEAYRAFRGRDPEIGPLFARRGLTE